MKNILLLIATVISLNCIGQETIKLHSEHYSDSNEFYPNEWVKISDHYYCNYYLMQCVDSSDYFMVIETILDKYSEYELYCYNDSTSTHTHLMKVYDRCYTQIGNLCEGYGLKLTCSNKDHYSWIHKLPNGLDAEFIEWLKLNK